MGFFAGELVSGPCEDAPCCGHAQEGGCPQPGEREGNEDKAYFARLAAIEDGEYFDDYEDDEEYEDEPEDDDEGSVEEDMGFFGYEGVMED